MVEKMNKILRRPLVHRLNMMKPENFVTSLGFFISDWSRRKNSLRMIHLKFLENFNFPA